MKRGNGVGARTTLTPEWDEAAQEPLTPLNAKGSAINEIDALGSCLVTLIAYGKVSCRLMTLLEQ